MEAFRRLIHVLFAFWFFLHHARLVGGLSLDIGSTANIKTAAGALAGSCMAFYHGDQPGGTVGLLPPNEVGNFNWWESGAFWGLMIEYWYYTGDDQYNAKIIPGLLNQIGPGSNFEPVNQTRVEGNDDQAFWAFAAMSAAEMKFPNPPAGSPSWLSLAQAVFNRQAQRWDLAHCNGGLRWQFNALNNGWMDKNTISNGCFFQLAARLARYTGNDTYAQWANKAYDWMAASPLITQDFRVFDSMTFNETTCPIGQLGEIQWTYNIGTVIAGCAFMYNSTTGAQQQQWLTRLNNYLTNTQRVFFPEQYGNQTMTEYACEGQNNCNVDQRSFKAYLARWLAVAAQLAPSTAGQIMPWLSTSALNAAKACSDTSGGLACGRTWYTGGDDGLRDVGYQMSALSIVQANLIPQAGALKNIQTGDSASNPSAGGGPVEILPDAIFTRKMTNSDKAGAWILTVVAMLACFGTAVALLVEEDVGLSGLFGSSRFG